MAVHREEFKSLKQDHKGWPIKNNLNEFVLISWLQSLGSHMLVCLCLQMVFISFWENLINLWMQLLYHYTEKTCSKTYSSICVCMDMINILSTTSISKENKNKLRLSIVCMKWNAFLSCLETLEVNYIFWNTIMEENKNYWKSIQPWHSFASDQSYVPTAQYREADIHYYKYTSRLSEHHTHVL